MNRNAHLAQKLCELVNSGSFRLPLSHTRSLDLLAALERNSTWNHIAAGPDAEDFKQRAKPFRAVLNAQIDLTAPNIPALSLQGAGLVIESIQGQPADSKATTYRHTFLPDPYGSKREFRVAPSPYPEAPEFYSQSKDPRVVLKELQALALQFPGDMEIQHRAASQLHALGLDLAAFEAWDKAFDMVRDDLTALLKKTPKLIITSALLSNRPFMRLLHGYVIGCLSAGKTREGERWARVGMNLENGNDRFGFSHLLLNALGERKNWRGVRTLTRKLMEDDESFSLLARLYLAQCNLNDPETEATAEKLIKANPFGAEVLTSTVADFPRTGEYIRAGSWMEGAELVESDPEEWRYGKAHLVLQTYQKEIRQAQLQRVKDLTERMVVDTTLARVFQSELEYRIPRIGKVKPLVSDAEILAILKTRWKE